LIQIPPTILEDIASYKESVAQFLSGRISGESFKARRVPMGIYEQRNPGTYMVRIRVPAGIILAQQLQTIATLADQYGNGLVHLTTRQDIQIHDVRIEDTPAIIDGLLEAGLLTRGGGGNTVRNCTACPRSGVCPDEVFDVRPHALALTEYLIQFRSSFNLPRKFKIAFSGCSRDCGLASVADLGFFAHRDAGRNGFAVFAAGGLGPNPSLAIQLEPFIEEGRIFLAASAIKTVFDLHGDRANRHRARFRYVLARLGPERLCAEYRLQIQRLQQEGLPGTLPSISALTKRISVQLQPGHTNGSPVTPLDLMPEKTNGYYTIRLHIPNGDISGKDLARIARVAQNFSQSALRATQDQDLLLVSVPRTSIGAVTGELQNLTFWPCDRGLPAVVACAGAATCKLGLCLSRNLANAIRQRIAGIQVPAQVRGKTIRISGCPNSCGQHLIADIGLAGRAFRTEAGLVPCYDVYAGGLCREGDARLGIRLATIPAATVPDMIALVLAKGLQDLERTVAGFAIDSQVQIPQGWYCDIGTSTPFSLAGRGPGECGAGVFELIRTDIEKARHALAAANSTGRDPLVVDAARLAARALLVIFGIEANADDQILAAFKEQLVGHGWVERSNADLCEGLFGGRIKGLDAFDQVQALLERVEALFCSLDSNLHFRLEPIADEHAGPRKVPAEVVDLRGVACPLNFVKAKLALEQVPVGCRLSIILDEGEPSENVPASLAEQGHQIVSIKGTDNGVYLEVIRGRQGGFEDAHS